ncbi:radical SAM protein [Desulfovibrio sp.]|uniref:radical SAM protein n=1 Tax=Desulfovibrio sp. TaxID=885 RepID=UPI0025BCD032|nr:radical SAM protein [Desulfovibrio sp.]
MKTVSARIFSLTLPWFLPAPHACALVPVFLPFRGCPVRCVFCAQDVQTGFVSAACPAGAEPDNAFAPRTALATAAGHSLPSPPRPSLPLDALLHETRGNLERRHALGLPPAELAFYGGTFTAMPEGDQAACLDLAALALARGWIRSFRCSTRPDCVTAPVLERLCSAGCRCVELGVQSFSDAALAASSRGYDGATALRACALVKDAGLTLGVQLLPGMPGHAPADFLADVPLALRAGADMLRFYPCLVLEGTALARMWRQGTYSPWPLEATLDLLAQGWLLAQAAHVPVIRMGLAPEAALDGAVLAGPVDRSLGSRVMGRALLRAVCRAVETAGDASGASCAPVLSHLRLPKSCQGYIWGTRGELRPAWAALGLEPKNARFDTACGQTLLLTLTCS